MSNPLFTLSWLIGDRLVRAERNDAQAWWLYFESGATLFIECLWRKLEKGVLISTSEDHGQQFGLPTPFDSIAVLEDLSPLSVLTVNVREGTADISLHFGEHICLEIISDSGGYEPWSATHPIFGTVFASAGGQLNAYKTA